MSQKSVDQMQQLKIVADIQPIWLRLDGRTLLHQFDLIVLETDLLNCPVDDVKDIQVDQTWLGGKLVFQRERAVPRAPVIRFSLPPPPDGGGPFV